MDAYNTPMAPAPPGYTSNLENPDNRAYQYYVTSSISTALMLGFVVARFYVRFWRLRSLWWDDLACFVATLATGAWTGSVIKICTVGVGKHMWDIRLSSYPEFRFVSILVAILSGPAIGFTKLTILLLYLRLFSVNTWVRRGTWAGIIFCLLYYTIITFIYIFDQDDAVLARVTYSVGVIGVISDVYIICLPLFAIYRLRLSLARKVALIGVFLTGILAAVMSLIGCIFRFTFNAEPPAADDLTTFLIPIYIVITVEIDIGIMCSCMPAIAALFKRADSRAPVREVSSPMVPVKRPKPYWFPSITSWSGTNSNTKIGSEATTTFGSLFKRPDDTRSDTIELRCREVVEDPETQ